MVLPDIEQLLERSVFHALRETTVHFGYIPDIYDYDIENTDNAIAVSEEERYFYDMQNIVDNKGFAVEVFNNSSTLDKGELKTPRIILETESFLPGQLGLDTTRVYKKDSNGFVVKRYQSLTSDFYFVIRLVTDSTIQARTLQGIMSKTLPRRGYLKRHQDNQLKKSKNLMVNYLSHSEYTWDDLGIKEKTYRYEIPDVHELDAETIDNVSKIKEIEPIIKTSKK